MAANVREKREVLRSDLNTCAWRNRDGARQLRYAGNVAAVRPRRLLDEASTSSERERERERERENFQRRWR